MKDGGPAYPSTRLEEKVAVNSARVTAKVKYPGMSLRDWFAGMALRSCNHQGSVEWLASEAYRMADAMLAEREKEK